MDTLITRIQEGDFFRERDRYEEAITSYQEALVIDPENAHVHHMMAYTYFLQDDSKTSLDKAITHIDQAIGSEPDNAYLFAFKGFVYVHDEQHKKALKWANQALAIDASCALAWLVTGQAHMQTREWKSAESALRAALKIDPDFIEAKNLLVSVLRSQNRIGEASMISGEVLSRDADNAMAHANKGYNHLYQEETKQAEDHFLAALRLEPNQEFAKEGLKQTYRARSFIYRSYLRYINFMQRFSEKKSFGFVIALIVGFRILRKIVESFSPILSAALIAVYLCFAFGSVLATMIGNSMILKDPVARLVLNRLEYLSGFVGIGFLCCLVTLPFVAYFKWYALLVLVVGFMISCIPTAHALESETPKGKYIFGGVSVFGLVVTVVVSLALAFNGQQTSALPFWLICAGFGGMGVSLLSTWLTWIPGLKTR